MAKVIRRLLTSGNLLFTLIFLAFLFIMINYVSSRRYTRLDLTRQQLSTLSDLTRQTLQHLEEPLTVIVFFQQGQQLYEFVRNLLKDYQRFAPEMRVEYVDPDQDRARAIQLVNQFQIEDPNVVVFQSGSRHKYVVDTELADFDLGSFTIQGQPHMKTFKGEAAFTSAILSVTQEEQPLVWFTTGHGEKSVLLEDPVGLSELKRYLEQQNVRVEEVALLESSDIPEEVRTVVIAGPIREFLELELARLEAYLETGGRLLILLDPLVESGLEGLLQRWGILVGDDVVVDPAIKLPLISPANLIVATYTQHPIVQQMKMNLITLFPLARSMRPAIPAPEGVHVTALAMTSPEGWGETDVSVETFERTDGEDLLGPVSVAVAAERLPVLRESEPGAARQAGPATPPARIVAIGDSDFVINGQLANGGNRDLFLGATNWLLDQEQLIGIGPRPIDTVKLNLTQQQVISILWFSLLVLPVGCIASGIGMWWLRRK